MIKRTQTSILSALVLSLVVTSTFQTNVLGQGDRPKHRLVHSTMAPGRIAHQFLLGDPSLASHTQPVQVVVPETSTVSILEQGSFAGDRLQHMTVGLTYGPVYHLRVSGIHGYPGVSVYPSIEMIGRLHPPKGLEVAHPIRIVLDNSDLRNAVQGKMITKVVYLEDPMTALPFRRSAGEQPYFDCGFAQDPFHVAERLGRVMAIVRIGSRMPINNELGQMGAGYAPVQHYESMLPPQAMPVEPNESQDANPLETKNRPVGNGVRRTAFNQQVNPIESPELMTQQSPSDEGLPMLSPHPNSDVLIQDSTLAAPPQTIQLPYANQGFIVQPDCPPVVNCPPTYCPPIAPLVQVPCEPAPCLDCNQCKESDIPEHVRDEWVCDGNDREKLVRVDPDFNVYGLDIEDTVGHFDTLDGRTLVAPSNRVCIYSPRFAAVRKVHQFGKSEFTTRAGLFEDKTQTEMARGKDFDATTLQNVRLKSSKRLNRASSMLDSTRGIVADNTIKLVGTRANFKTFEDLQLMRWGKHRSSENTRLQLGMESAKAWNDNLEPQMSVKDAQPVIVNDAAQLGEIISVESDLHPTLRLCKIASRISAKQGETLDFSIRFDNLGQERIGNVTIMDNLSPRLEFVEGSAECTLDANFSTEPNEAGSHTLRWEITDPIDIGKGGVIRFQCRVR